MSSSSSEPEFLDSRPETARHAAGGAAAPQLDAQDLDAEEEEGDDDLVFYDAAADSGLDIQVIAPPRAASSPSSATNRPLPPTTETAKPSLTASGRHKKTTSSRMRVSGVHQRVALGATQDEWSRRERSKADRDAALERFKALAHAPPRDESHAGRDMGPFKVKRFVCMDRGALTYLAADEGTPDPVMLRIYPFKGTYGPEFKALAERGERVCRVQSPFLNVVLASGRTKECFFVGSELPLGETLEELVARGETFDQSEVCSLIEQVARGLKVLHARQLFHGGVSLKTIRRERKDVYVLEDSGITRARAEFSFLSGGGEVVGEPGFVAPEAVDTGVGSPEADLYALGCVAWTLLAGRPPFSGPDPVQVLLDQLNGEVPWILDQEGVSGVSEGTATIVKKLTGYTVTVRYRSVTDLSADLNANLSGQAVKPFPAELRPDHLDDGPSQSLDAGTVMLVLLMLLDVALAASVALTWVKTQQIPLADPIGGYELPLPGVSEGGYRGR